MNKTLIFFCLSTAILALSLIVVCISPIFNNIKGSFSEKNPILNDPDVFWDWSISSWRTLNCKYFEDKQNDENVKLDDIQKYKKMKTLCKAKKAMHDLEFASLVINLILGFVCANLSLLHFLDVGKDFEKKTGLIGFVTGIIGLILTLVYVCFNGYIFNNDIAYGYWYVDSGNNIEQYFGGVEKYYSNGAVIKKDGASEIHVYENDKSDFSKYAKYKDLGGKQYNYDSKYYKAHVESKNNGNRCLVDGSTSGCEYIFPKQAFISNDNKDLYDRWTTTLTLSIFIVACNIGLLIFGFLLFKGGEESNGPKTVEIQ